MDASLIYLVMLLLVVLVWNWRFIGLDKLFGGGAPAAGTENCRWRRVAPAQGETPARFRCLACGVEAGTTDGKRPARCLRAGRDI